MELTLHHKRPGPYDLIKLEETMTDMTNSDAAYITADSCDLDDFARLCERTLDRDAVPNAQLLEHDIPIYDGPSIRPALQDQARRRTLMAEWARNLRSGSGIVVITGGYEDTSVVDDATSVYLELIDSERQSHVRADHFAASGSNDRLWNSLQKMCLADPGLFARYFGNTLIDAVCEAWLGPNYQMTAQVNLVHPGGKAQTAHRDYHLGFQTAETCARYPAHVHDLSPVMTLQAGIAHCDMSLDSGPTKLLPFSQAYREGYAAYRLPEFADYFEKHHVQLPLSKGDLLFFNPALFHAAGENRTEDMDRFVNLMQVGSAMGRTLENVDRYAMSLALYPVLLEKQVALTSEETEAAIACCAEGYPFPTNLDTDPPVGGLAPPSMADIMRAALDRGDKPEAFREALDEQRRRQGA